MENKTLNKFKKKKESLYGCLLIHHLHLAKINKPS